MLARILAFALLLPIATVDAQQRPPSNQRQAPVQRIESGWQQPVDRFAEAFNNTAARLNEDDRLVETDCADRGTPVRVCTFQFGASLPIHTAAGADRRSLKEVTVFLNPHLGAPAYVSLMSVFTVLNHHLEPGISMGERSASFSAIFDAHAIRTRPTTVRLGRTRFTMQLIPGLQIILTAERVS